MSTLAMMNKGKCISGYPRESSMKPVTSRAGRADLDAGSSKGQGSRGLRHQGVSATLGMIAVVLTLSATMRIVGSHSKINKT